MQRDPPPPPAPRASGALIVLAIFVGVAAGVAFRQPTIGVLGGLAVGIAVALVQWRRDERGR